MKIAAFTMIYNEEIFFPIWLKYYSSQLGKENLFVIDDGSDIDILNKHEITNRFTFYRRDLCEKRRAEFISNIQSALLSYYDVVIFSDVDELIIANSLKYKNLFEFAEKNTDRFYNAVGLNIIHNHFEEPSIDLSKSIFSQRKYVRFHGMFCKPLFTKISVNWHPGYHNCNLGYNLNEDLFLYHLRTFDYNLTFKRIQNRNITLTSENRNQGLSTHFELTNNDYMKYAFSDLKENFENAIEDDKFKDEIEKFNAAQNMMLKFKVKGKIKKLSPLFLNQLQKLSI